VGPGDNVIIPSYVCTALLNAVRYVGATPRFADIDPDDLNISPDDVRRKVTKKTRAVIVPHMFGLPARVREIQRAGVPVIEDCAQAVGAKIGEQPVGTFGDIAIFSFYATKVMTTCGEGGMVVTRNRRWSEAIRQLRDYDEKNDLRTRYNYKMTDAAAAMGSAQLAKLGGFIRKRRAIAKRYDAAFAGKEFFIDRAGSGSNIYFRYLVRIRRGQAEFLRRAAAHAVGVKRPVFRPLHAYFGISDRQLPHTASAWRSIFSIPIYPSLPEKDVDTVISFLLNYPA
ncbi:MAG TPA: DegT/DnrJ/EryC1/StrS family aminotransferase, partial [bacterium]|nr:DegT/DnrJ/EryC1/StrS family aminotransferase [bacterium]